MAINLFLFFFPPALASINIIKINAVLVQGDASSCPGQVKRPTLQKLQSMIINYRSLYRYARLHVYIQCLPLMQSVHFTRLWLCELHILIAGSSSHKLTLYRTVLSIQRVLILRCIVLVQSRQRTSLNVRPESSSFIVSLSETT